MKLKGQAKEDFEFWWQQKPKGERGIWYKGSCETFDFGFGLEHFYRCSDSMQYGVYVDWFDSVGISLFTYSHFINDNQYYFEWAILSGKHFVKRQCEDSRLEARTAAIEKANEIYNNIHK